LAYSETTRNLPKPTELSLAEQVAQMFVIRASGHLFDHQIRYPAWEPPAEELKYLVAELGVGGVLLPVGHAGDVMLRTQQLQSWAKIPLLLASDIEEGTGQRFDGATWFPPPMALGAIAGHDVAKAENYAEQMGFFTAQEALALGFNWVLGPVVDVNNNPDNPVINVRSFGQTPEIVSRLATAFIRGAHQWPVLTVAKHFPGHGDTATDSHLELPTLPHSPERLAQIELPPFAAAIQAGVDAVMSAHLVIQSWDVTRPATLSAKILTGQLRETMGFNGLIVTDALVMGAIANEYGPNEAPILALEAGADILLMPADPAAAIQAVCEAVKAGRISPERIQASVERIWQCKQKIYSESSSLRDNKSKEPNIVSRLTQLATPAARKMADNILRDSMQMRGILPIQSQENESCRNLIVLDDLFHCDVLGYHAPAVNIPQQLGYHLQLADRHNNWLLSEFHSPTPAKTLMQILIRGNPFRGSQQVSQAVQDWVKNLLATDQLQGIVVYGSPYTFEQVLSVLPSELPAVFSYGQLLSAQALALETLFGHSFSLSQVL
jgi:beta-glucosidase